MSELTVWLKFYPYLILKTEGFFCKYLIKLKKKFCALAETQIQVRQSLGIFFPGSNINKLWEMLLSHQNSAYFLLFTAFFYIFIWTLKVIIGDVSLSVAGK